MRKLSEIDNEEKLDILADILEPLTKIMSDKEIGKAAKKTYLEAIIIAIKEHKKEVIEILARIDNVPVEDYKYGMLELPVQLIAIMQDGDLLSFFGFAPNVVTESSGEPMANTEAEET